MSYSINGNRFIALFLFIWIAIGLLWGLVLFPYPSGGCQQQASNVNWVGLPPTNVPQSTCNSVAGSNMQYIEASCFGAMGAPNAPLVTQVTNQFGQQYGYCLYQNPNYNPNYSQEASISTAALWVGIVPSIVISFLLTVTITTTIVVIVSHRHHYEID